LAGFSSRLQVKFSAVLALSAEVSGTPGSSSDVAGRRFVVDRGAPSSLAGISGEPIVGLSSPRIKSVEGAKYADQQQLPEAL
jgi:hypothetical protein